MKVVITRTLLLLSLLLLNPAAQAMVLKIATISPDGTAWMKAMRAGAEDIKQRTDGRVRLKFYPGGVMGNDENVLRKMRIGQLHGGAVTPGSLRKAAPDIDIYGLPFLFDNLQQVDKVRSELDAPILEKLEAGGYISFGFAEGGFTYMMADDKLDTVPAVKSQKVWIPVGNRVGEEVFKQAGISPVSLPLSDVMTGLQTGLIDTVITSPIGALALQWHTRVKYAVDLPLTYYTGLLVISKRAWKKVKAEDRKIVREVMQQVFREIDDRNRQDNIAAREALINQGIEFITLDDEVRAAWYEVGERATAELEKEIRFSPELYQQLKQLTATGR